MLQHGLILRVKYLAVMLAMFVCGNALAEAPRRVFVMRFAGNGVSDEKVRVVQDMVVVEAGRLPGLQVTNYLDVVNLVTQEQARGLRTAPKASGHWMLPGRWRRMSC
mgnify:CR=1 FL=1